MTIDYTTKINEELRAAFGDAKAERHREDQLRAVLALQGCQRSVVKAAECRLRKLEKAADRHAGVRAR